MLHGNGSMAEELVSSGVVEMLAERRRVVVIDRPGFGRSGCATVGSPSCSSATCACSSM
jgi:pimeloyl-ACP methyl ester carboxylesterase